MKDPVKHEALIVETMKRAGDAIREMLTVSTAHSAHIFDVGSTPEGQMYSCILLIARKEELEAILRREGYTDGSQASKGGLP